MYSIQKHYHAKTIEDACLFLAKTPTAKPICGGTDLLVKLRHNPHNGAAFVQVSDIPDLHGIRVDDEGNIEIGAAESFSNIAENEIIRKRVTLLSEAAVSMGGPQIRNVASIGGNICNGAVSADSAASLLALDARLHLSSVGSTRVVPIQEFFLGPGKVDRRTDEILTKVVLPRAGREKEGSSYLKYSMRAAMDIATIGVAAACILRADGTIDTLYAAATVVAPTPIRLTSCEQAAQGLLPTEENLRLIAALCTKDTNARTSWRASKEFREHILTVYLRRAISTAVHRAKL